jgi:hypothetical protein
MAAVGVCNRLLRRRLQGCLSGDYAGTVRKLAEGQEAEADQLIEKAKKLDKSALKEPIQDLE